MSPRSYDWIAHHAATRGDKVAMNDLGTGRVFTYSQMNDRTSRLATALKDEFGINFGDRVAVLAENNTNFFEVEFACWKLGAVFVPLNWRLTLPELEYIVGDASPDLMIHDDAFTDNAIKLAEICSISHRMCWGAAPATPLHMKKSCYQPIRWSEVSGAPTTTSSQSCTPRARPAAPRAPSSPTA